MKKIKLGFVGCGRVSNFHFNAISKLNGAVEIVAVCDPNQARSLEVAKQFNAASYTELEQMLASDLRMDIITIATPNGQHPEHSIMCARAGYDVLCEKPMAVKYEDALELLNVFASEKRNFFLIHQNRYNEPVMFVKDAITQGRFGKIYTISSNVFWHRAQEYYDKQAWHGTSDMDGGAFMTQGSHYIDLLNWFAASKLKHVYACTDTLGRDIDTEDTGSVIIKWQNGLIGNLNLTVLTYPDDLEGSITILGEKGTVRLGGIALNKLEYAEFADEKQVDVSKLNYETESVYGFGHQRLYEDIVAFYNGNSSPSLVDINDAFSSFSIQRSILDSSKSNQPILFDNI